jgi:hypothetical protein
MNSYSLRKKCQISDISLIPHKLSYPFLLRLPEVHAGVKSCSIVRTYAFLRNPSLTAANSKGIPPTLFALGSAIVATWTITYIQITTAPSKYKTSKQTIMFLTPERNNDRDRLSLNCPPAPLRRRDNVVDVPAHLYVPSPPPSLASSVVKRSPSKSLISFFNLPESGSSPSMKELEGFVLATTLSFPNLSSRYTNPAHHTLPISLRPRPSCDQEFEEE